MTAQPSTEPREIILTGTKRSSKRVDRRQMIRDEAARIFATRGYASSSLQEVADNVGLTKAAVYYYFKSKESLLFDILTFADLHVSSILARELDASSHGLEAVERVVGAHVLWYLQHPDVGKVAFRDWAELTGDLRTTQIERRRKYGNVLRTAIRRFVNEGPHPLSIDLGLIANFINGAVATTNIWFRPDGPQDAGTVARSIGRMAAMVVHNAACGGLPLGKKVSE